MVDRPATVGSLAVTGPTGAGKSRFCARLAEHGAQVIEADAIGHRLLTRSDVRDEVVAVFGREILADDGGIDRRRLGGIVFASHRRREELDALVHPPLAAACIAELDRARRQGSPLVILEAAVYFLLPGPPPVDLTITVTAPSESRLARLIATGIEPARALGRISAQDHLEPTWERSDRTIVNDGDEAALLRAADMLWRELTAPGSQGGVTS
jgi:dephospho-CoA kinase